MVVNRTDCPLGIENHHRAWLGSVTDPTLVPVTANPTDPQKPRATQGDSGFNERRTGMFCAPCTVMGDPTCLLQDDPPGDGSR